MTDQDTHRKNQFAVVNDGFAVDISSTDHTFDTPMVLRVGGAGNVSVKLSSGVDIVEIFAGPEWYPVTVTKVYKTGTTVTAGINAYRGG